MTWVNQIHYGYDELPFGGVKASGLRQGARDRGARLATSRSSRWSSEVSRKWPSRSHNEGPLGFITLDNPPANSYDLEFMTEFSEAVDEAVVGATRVVIVQSANPKFFSAGADIKQFLEGDVDSNMEMIKVSQAAFRRMAAAPQVFIAYIAGHALGGGLEITLACDIRLGGGRRLQAGYCPRSRSGCCPATAAPSG